MWFGMMTYSSDDNRRYGRSSAPRNHSSRTISPGGLSCTGAVENIPEQAEPIVGADRHEIRPGLRVVVPWQTNRAALMPRGLVKHLARRLQDACAFRGFRRRGRHGRSLGDDVALWRRDSGQA